MPRISIQVKLNAFLTVYFFELEAILNADQASLSQLKFQSEESNTDEYVKLFLKEKLLINNSILHTKIKSVFSDLLSQDKPIKIASFNGFKITSIYLPKELPNELKTKLSKSKRSVYTNPDLLLKIEGYNKVFYESIEIKSTKNNSIRGSSIQQINPNEWVIFIKRNATKIQVVTGQYLNSITEKLPFPDRSPRPIIAFNTLMKWNKANRYTEEQILVLKSDPAVVSQKLKLLTDWQDFLAEEWMDIILAKKKGKTERWFNNALRKFAIRLLSHSSKLTEKELSKLIKSLKERLE